MTTPSEERFMEWIEQRPRESFGSRRARLMAQFLTLDSVGIGVAFFAVSLASPRGFDLEQTVSLSIVALASYIFAAFNTNAFSAELSFDLVESLKRVLLTLLLSTIAILTFMFFCASGRNSRACWSFLDLSPQPYFLLRGAIFMPGFLPVVARQT